MVARWLSSRCWKLCKKKKKPPAKVSNVNGPKQAIEAQRKYVYLKACEPHVSASGKLFRPSFGRPVICVFCISTHLSQKDWNVSMFITIYYGDQKSLLFNPRCSVVNLLNSIKERCGYGDTDRVLDLTDETGKFLLRNNRNRTKTSESLRSRADKSTETDRRF